MGRGQMETRDSKFWPLFCLATCLKLILIPAYHSTDFEVHRNWLAITHSLPMQQWYTDTTSEWTLDYPPFFAYFEWALAKVAQLIDPKMLHVSNLNYASAETKYFQRISVMIMDLVFAWGVQRCLKVLRKLGLNIRDDFAEAFLLLNVGLIFVDHIHFQYNGFLFGILLLSISFLLEDRVLLATITFACLLNFKHIFLYMAPAFGIYLLKFYCFDAAKNPLFCIVKLLAFGLTPFVLSFGPFVQQLPQLLSRLFPFKRGVTHAYWAPNFWALYNTADKVAAVALKKPSSGSFTSGLVQEFDHTVLPSIRPLTTFVLTVAAMLPMLLRLWCYSDKRESKFAFLRSVVLCSLASFMFGWHVHEKAILMCLIPMCFLFFVSPTDAKYTIILSAVGYFSLLPLLFQTDLLPIRYCLFAAYMGFMLTAYLRYYKTNPNFNILEILYIFGLILIPLYEHVASPALGLHKRLPFMPLLLTSLYCSFGVLYVFIGYYIHALDLKFMTKKININEVKTSKNSFSTVSKPTKAKTKTPSKPAAKKEKTK